MYHLSSDLILSALLTTIARPPALSSLWGIPGLRPPLRSTPPCAMRSRRSLAQLNTHAIDDFRRHKPHPTGAQGCSQMDFDLSIESANCTNFDRSEIRHAPSAMTACGLTRITTSRFIRKVGQCALYLGRRHVSTGS